jgi:hypothetical protein
VTERRRRDVSNSILLLALTFIALRLLLPPTGLYLDDWAMLEQFGGGRPLGEALRAAAQQFAGRPVEIALVPLFFRVAESTAGRLALLLALQWAEVGLVFLFLRRATGQPATSAAAALAVALFPSRPIIHVWVSSAPQLAAHGLAFASLLAHLRWRRLREGRALAVSQACYLLSVLTYESAAFAPLLLLAVDLHALGVRRWKEAVRPLAPYALSLACAAAWQRLGASWIGQPNARALGFDAFHALKTFGLGLGATTAAVPALAARALLPAAFSDLGAWRCAGLVLFAAAAGARADRGLADEEDRPRLVWAWLAAAALVAAYLPFALSADYLPSLLGVLSRTNAAGAWAFGMGAAALAAAWPRPWRRARPWALAAAVLGCGARQWTSGMEYARASREQERILEGAARALAKAPDARTVLLSAPSHVGSAVVFEETYDFAAALRLRTGRALDANVVSSRMRFLRDRVVERRGEAVAANHPYAGLYLYDAGAGALFSVAAPVGSQPPRMTSK